MRAIWWMVRLAVKDLVCFFGLGDRLTEYCEVCGRRQPLYWWAPNALWEHVTGYATPDGDNASGILCPECFDRMAKEYGIALRWMPSNVTVPTPRPVGSIPQSER